jgi:hypothetical protein
MKTYSIIIRWLVIAALADWLVGRTLTRLIIFMPKPSFMIWVFEVLDAAGRTLATLAGLLAIIILLGLAWNRMQTGRERYSALIWLVLVSLSLGFLFVQPAPALKGLFQVGMISALLVAGWKGWMNVDSADKKLAVLFPTLALAVGVFAQNSQIGLSLQTVNILQFGELFVVLSPLILWWVYGRNASLRIWLFASIPVLVFTAGLLSSPAEVGILVIWSTGLTLYLPWPIYSISLWLAGVTILSSGRQEMWPAQSLLLLIAGGFAPQLSTHAFFGLIALLLFSVPEAHFKQQTVKIPKLAVDKPNLYCYNDIDKLI